MSNHDEIPDVLKKLLFGDVSTPGLFHRLDFLEQTLDELSEALVDRGECHCHYLDGPMRHIPEIPAQVYRATSRTDAYHASLN